MNGLQTATERIHVRPSVLLPGDKLKVSAGGGGDGVELLRLLLLLLLLLALYGGFQIVKGSFSHSSCYVITV